MPRLLTLLTDFGDRDVYVGVMKGTIAQVNPQISIVDLTHAIPTQDLWAARFNLLNAFPYFPPGTVHLAVVDPGVGSDRRGVAIQIADCFLVGPDNGIFSGILATAPVQAAIVLTNSRYWRTPSPSNTFHGRDIFAPVAAHLANQVPLIEFGSEVDPTTLVTLNLPDPQRNDCSLIGYIQHWDHFGNLITTIPNLWLPNASWQVSVGNHLIPSGRIYSDAAPGNLIALPGSHGWLEIAINCGHAQSLLKMEVGDQLQVTWG